MSADAWRAIPIIAENCARQQWQRRVPLVLLTVASFFYVPPFFAHSWDGETEVLQRVMSLTDTALGLMGVACFFLSVNLYASEASRRTLVAVMVHPVETWALLCGRLLGLIFWYVTLTFAMLLAASALAIHHGTAPDLALAGQVLQSTVTSIAWITFGGSLATLVPPFLAVTIIASLAVAHRTFQQVWTTAPLWMQYLKQLFYFASMVSPNPSTAWAPRTRFDAATAFDALRTADTLLYAATVFIVCSALLHRRDVPTRGG